MKFSPGLALFAASLICGNHAFGQNPPQTQTPPANPSQPQQNPPPQQQQPAPQNQPAPLFGGSLGIKSSEKKKESATLGFNGIDPSGKVDAKMLSTSATPTDEEKVQKMTALIPAPADLDAFLRDGGLKKR